MLLRPSLALRRRTVAFTVETYPTVPRCLPPPSTLPPPSFHTAPQGQEERGNSYHVGQAGPRPPSQARPQAATMTDVLPLPPRYVTATATTVRSCCDSGGKRSKERQGGIWLLHDAQGLDMDDPVRSALIPSLGGEYVVSPTYPTLVACGA